MTASDLPVPEQGSPNTEVAMPTVQDARPMHSLATSGMLFVEEHQPGKPDHTAPEQLPDDVPQEAYATPVTIWPAGQARDIAV